MTKKIFGLTLASILALAGCGVGDKEEVKKEEPVKHEAASLVVINVLDPELYEDAHIKGSINVPYEQVEEYLKKTDKNNELVFYCANYACSASGEAAQEAKAAGFNAHAYEGGMAEWVTLGYPHEGDAKQGYIHEENKKPDHLADFAIFAEDLKAQMQEHNIL